MFGIVKVICISLERLYADKQLERLYADKQKELHINKAFYVQKPY